jgi:alkylation response protein AidB-like acyl-CoA dehydrogenase
VDLGLAGLLVPERLGGAGATVREASVVMEELGRFVAPVPFLESSIIATTVLLAEDNDLIADLAGGRRVAALLAPFTAASRVDLPVATLHDGRLSGRASSVAGAVDADVLLVPVAATDGLEVYAVDSGSALIEPVSSLDMTRPLADVTLSGVAGQRVVSASRGAIAVDRGLLLGASLLASEAVGLSAWCLDTTLAYLKDRRQFGRPLASFQALKHRLADLFVQVESAGAAAHYAAGVWAADDPDAPIATAVATSYCRDAAVRAAEEAVQLHGGLGMTWEHSAHLYLKRAKADQLSLGRPDGHREVLARLIDLGG